MSTHTENFLGTLLGTTETRWLAQHIINLPIPKYHDTELQRKILQTDNECIIEKLVSGLYDFSNDEIAYIENREP